MVTLYRLPSGVNLLTISPMVARKRFSVLSLRVNLSCDVADVGQLEKSSADRSASCNYH
jgi:hypothetical protein